MIGIKIIEPGMLTLIQDSGRTGYQQFGVSASGVMDAFSHRIGNILVGNEALAAVLEATYTGPRVEFLTDGVIAITGADMTPWIGDHPVPMWKSLYVHQGQVLSFKGLKNGCRSYISFAGGIDVPAVMGSKSTDLKGRIGGVQGRALIAGDRVQTGPASDRLHLLKNKCLHYEDIPVYTQSNTVRVVLGPQDLFFTEKGKNTFLNTAYTVAPECDRMGYRLTGEAIEHEETSDIISDGITMGAIQVPGQGQPIIMMADRQTTGGYAKIAAVISSDLWKVAQAKPGDVICFEAVTIAQAQQCYREQAGRIERIKEYIDNQKVIVEKQFDIRVNGEQFRLQVEEIKRSAE